MTSPRIDFPRLHGPVVGFSPLFVLVVFVFGFWFGACVNPWPGAGGSFMPSIVQYVWAIKLIAWDFRYLSHLLETWTGAPILTGSFRCLIYLLHWSRLFDFFSNWGPPASEPSPGHQRKASEVSP